MKPHPEVLERLRLVAPDLDPVSPSTGSWRSPLGPASYCLEPDGSGFWAVFSGTGFSRTGLDAAPEDEDAAPESWPRALKCLFIFIRRSRSRRMIGRIASGMRWAARLHRAARGGGTRIPLNHLMRTGFRRSDLEDRLD